MTITASPMTDQQFEDIDYETALERLRAYRAQLDQADQQADAGSLGRAADLAWIYENAKDQWIAEIGEPKITHHRGRPVVRDSRSRFAKWAKAKLDLDPVYSYRLLRADEIRGIVLPVGKVIPGLGERVLRPLYKVLKEERGHEAPDIWRRALRLADGKTPTNAHVRQALRDHDKATGRTATDRTQAYYQRTIKDAHDKALREANWIREHGTEEDQKAFLLAVHAMFTTAK